MKKKLLCLFIICLMIFGIPFAPSSVYAYAEDSYYLGGIPAGFSIHTDGAFVAGVCDVITENGIKSPSKDAEIQYGDTIISIDGVMVNTARDIENVINNKKECLIIIERDNNNIIKIIKPIKDVNGNFKLGLFIKDSINGIGTITYVKNGRFASLGHPVLDETNKIMKIRGGEIMSCSITGINKGERGTPGELKGVFLKTLPIGSIDKNIESGVYGNISTMKNEFNLRKIDLGTPQVGDASIFTTIEGQTPKEYDIQIIKCDNLSSGTKNLVIKIVDDELIKYTGGIVQGMSGSPIVQNGRLVGAVTHVFINDPTRGYGINISNMINN